MDYWKACQLLGVDDADDSDYVKKRYRSLMQQYHPDSSGSDPRLVLRAQLINEAYAVIKKQMAGRKSSGSPGREAWQGPGGGGWDFPQNEDAFWPRDIYLSKAFYEDYRLDGYKIARGKYFWDAEREDFNHLLLSLNQLCSDRLEEIERRYAIYNVGDYGLAGQQAAYKARIFHLLVQQFIDPIDSLHKTYRINDMDRKGRSIFLFPASVAVSDQDQTLAAAGRLEAGDRLYPAAIRDNRIWVRDDKGFDLGYISFEDDSLYYMVIPALATRSGTVKLSVRDQAGGLPGRTGKARIDIDFYLRLEQEEEDRARRKDMEQERNRTIRRLLMEYESYIRSQAGSRETS